MMHAVENPATPILATVEFIDGPNPPLPVPNEVRLKTPG